MFKRDEERREHMGAAPSAFLHLSDEGAVELEEHASPARRAFAILLAGLVLLAVPLLWVNAAQGGGDQPLAVKYGNSGSNSGPGSGDDDDDDDHPDNSGPGNAEDDDATTDGTTDSGAGISNTGTGDTASTTGDGSAVTASGTTQGTGPSDTNTRDTATGTQTKQDTGDTGGTGTKRQHRRDEHEHRHGLLARTPPQTVDRSPRRAPVCGTHRVPFRLLWVNSNQGVLQ